MNEREMTLQNGTLGGREYNGVMSKKDVKAGTGKELRDEKKKNVSKH